MRDTDPKRLFAIDLARFAGIVMVVCLHTPLFPEQGIRSFCAFFMPLFFVLSGILIAHKKEATLPLRHILPARARRLFLPYVIFQIPSLARSFYQLQKGTAPSPLIFPADCADVVTLKGISVFWFLPALFFAEAVVLFLLKRFSPAGAFCCLVPALVIVPVLSPALSSAREQLFLRGNAGGTLPVLSFAALSFVWMLVRSLLCAALTAFGVVLYPLYLRLPALLGAPLLACAVFASYVNGVADLNNLRFGLSPVLYLASALLGSVGISLLGRLFTPYEKSAPFRLFAWYGRSSLIIMVTHLDWYVVYAVQHLLSFLAARPSLFVPCAVVFVFLLEIPIILLLTPIINRAARRNAP